MTSQGGFSAAPAAQGILPQANATQSRQATMNPGSPPPGVPNQPGQFQAQPPQDQGQGQGGFGMGGGIPTYKAQPNWQAQASIGMQPQPYQPMAYQSQNNLGQIHGNLGSLTSFPTPAYQSPGLMGNARADGTQTMGGQPWAAPPQLNASSVQAQLAKMFQDARAKDAEDEKTKSDRAYRDMWGGA